MQELNVNKYYSQPDEEASIEDINYPQLILKIAQFYKQLSELRNLRNEANTIDQKVKDIQEEINSLKKLKEDRIDINDDYQKHLYIGHVTDLNKIFACSNIYTSSDSGMHSGNTSNHS